MNQINRVTILGAGAMGASYASMFQDACFSVSLVARGDRKRRLMRDGLVVNGTRYVVEIIHPDDQVLPADLIIVALKDHHLPGAIRDLENLIGDETIILSVMNGLDSERALGEVYGMDKVLYAIAVGIDALRVGNKVYYTTTGKILFGEKYNKDLSPSVRRVQSAFERAGIIFETPEDMMRVLWWKFMVNVGMNQASAVMRAPYGVFLNSPDARALMESLMREVIVLAEAEGVSLGEDDLQEWDKLLGTLNPEGKTSMLQDIEAGRITEVEMFGGKVLELGKKHGIPTPVNQTVLSAIRVLQANSSER